MVQKENINEVDRLKQFIRELGACPDCLQVPEHHVDEPFSTCKCGTGEDYAHYPLQELQILVSKIKGGRHGR